MKRIGLAIIAVLFMASAGYVATSWKTTDTEDTSVNGGEIVMLENESSTGNNWMSLNTIKTWLLGGTQDATFNAFTAATANLGVASTTTGLLNFYNSGSAYPVGLFSVGASTPSVGFRLPGTMPSGDSVWVFDTSGYASNVLVSTLQDGTGTDDQNASEVATSTSNFNGNLSSADDTVQKALDTLDELAGGSGTDDQTASEVNGSWTGTLLSAITTVQAAIQVLATELDNAVDITAGTGITITDGQLSVTTNTYQPYDANMITWPSTINATEVGYLDGLTDTIANLLSGKQTANAALNVDAIEFVIDGGGSAITTGVKGYIEVPYAATINRASLVCGQSGSIVVDIWKDTYTNYPPTVADTITASAKPTLSSAIKAQDATLTGWTTSVAAGDWLGFNVDSATTVQRCTLSLKVAK